jgi:hypothetical protein
MSTSTSSRTILAARCAERVAAVLRTTTPGLEQLAAWAATARPGTAGWAPAAAGSGVPAGNAARLGALPALTDELRATLAGLAPAEWASAERLLSQPTAPVGSARSAELADAMADAVYTAGSVARRATRDVTADAVAAAAADIGLVVAETARAKAATALELRVGRHGVAVVTVADDGRVERHYVGLPAETSCHRLDDELVQAAGRHGVTLTHTRRIDHNDPGGGAAIAEARRRGPTLAAGAAAAAQRWRRPADRSGAAGGHGPVRARGVR